MLADTRSAVVDYKTDVAMPLSMIFQSDYLTIKDVNREFNTYLLEFPNREVREGLATLLMRLDNSDYTTSP